METVSWIKDVFQQDKVNYSKNMTFLTIGAVNKNIRIKIKFRRQSWT